MIESLNMRFEIKLNFNRVINSEHCTLNYNLIYICKRENSKTTKSSQIDRLLTR